MNPRQRRGVLLLIIAVAGAVGVFVLVSGYVSEVRSQVSPTTTALRLSRDVPPLTTITPEMYRAVEIPQRWAPREALLGPSALDGQVAAAPLRAGAFLQVGMIEDEPQLEPGQRELAILVNAETGVAGKIGRGSIVDIAATFPGEEERRPQAQIVVPSARIIEVGRVQQAAPDQSAPPQADPDQVVPVTFALSVEEALIVTYAESFAQEVRLALVREGDGTSVAPDDRVYSLPREGPANTAEQGEE